MRLVRLVAAGLVLGALIGFFVALLRPRSATGVDLDATADRRSGRPGQARKRSLSAVELPADATPLPTAGSAR
jgi:hypothetical protein